MGAADSLEATDGQSALTAIASRKKALSGRVTSPL
eukprot:COSAG02_NODE_3394_length_6814_cov_8.672971_1_plen_35_part_00